jgi:hydroxyacylglutathione hydrolase
MILDQISTSGDRNFGYLLADSDAGQAAVIDPSGAPGLFIARLEARRLALKWVICTHGHYDHTSGSHELHVRYGAPLALHRASTVQPDIALDDEQDLELGALRLKVIHTPGHTDDSICLYVSGAVFTGDTLFVGKVGGTDFAEGARLQFESLHRKLLSLPHDTLVYPGHDVGVRPTSTIGQESKQNPFLLQPDFDHFVDLKRNWLKYKAEHGIQ